MDKIKIYSVSENSIADELGISPGDYLTGIDGKKIKDIFDYKFFITAEYLELQIEKADKSEWVFEIEKDEWEDLGLEFENWLIDEAKSCHNKCIFCFIDQLPKNMRETLYFKDDDARLSFLTGNYITFTNMKEEELERIIDYKFSPINISVHTTDPELRVKMLNNKNAGKALLYIKKLYDAGIEMNFQIVLVKGVNDNEHLLKTILDLSSYMPVARSLSVVPVGLTKYREGLYKIEPFSEDEAKNVIKTVSALQEKFKKKHDNAFVFCSDEFYIKAKLPLPAVDFYEGFPQIENGVGMMSLFMDEVAFALENKKPKSGDKKFSIITGEAAYPFMKKIADSMTSKYHGLVINTYPVQNRFFGENITVSGLLTGQDIIFALKQKELGSTVLLPENVLRSGEPVLLDGITIDALSNELKTKVLPVKVNGEELVSTIWRLK